MAVRTAGGWPPPLMTSGGQIAVDGDEGWVASGEYLVRFNADAGVVDGLAALPRSARAPGTFPAGLTLALGPDDVWTTDPSREVLLRYPRGGR